MLLARTRDGFEQWRATIDSDVGCVLTMGFLHSGHAALVEKARAQCGVVVATLFVNPGQFSPDEDYVEYPRNEETDLALLRAGGVDMVFIPTREEMYPNEDHAARAGGIGGNRSAMGTVVETAVGTAEVNEGGCEGWVRPHFFAGVATVVVKFLNVIRPNKAYFGQKDYQQCCVVRAAVTDLLMATEIVVVETQREDDGLAMSSRNAYLEKSERPNANAVYLALEEARKQYQVSKVTDAAALRSQAKKVLDSYGDLFRLQYISVADKHSLKEVETVDPAVGAVMAMAAVLGKTRLIDNMVLPAIIL